MAEVTQITNQFKYDFDFTNASGSTASRSFTIDTKNFEAGLSHAKALQDFFAGTGSLSVASIVPKEFIQPTGWRDNNPAEPPWTTEKVYLTGITKYETSYDPAGGGGGGDEAVIQLEYDSDIDAVTITYQGTSTPQVFKADGTTVSIRAGNPGYWFIENVVSGTTYFVFTAPDATLAAGSATITIP